MVLNFFNIYIQKNEVDCLSYSKQTKSKKKKKIKHSRAGPEIPNLLEENTGKNTMIAMIICLGNYDFWGRTPKTQATKTKVKK